MCLACTCTIGRRFAMVLQVFSSDILGFFGAMYCFIMFCSHWVLVFSTVYQCGSGPSVEEYPYMSSSASK